MKKRTKNEIIEDLKKEIVKLVNENEGIEKRNRDWKVFYGELFFLLYGEEERQFYFTEKAKLIERIGDIIKNESELKREIDRLKETNDKYWRLIRGIAGDRTLEIEVKQQNQTQKYDI
ncbi:MAG: hypothetical protein V3574_04360 [Candidatus Moraniibacteriota bacterium]